MLVFISKQDVPTSQIVWQDRDKETTAFLNFIENTSKKAASKVALKLRCAFRIEKCLLGPRHTFKISHVDWQLYQSTRKRYFRVGYQFRSYVPRCSSQELVFAIVSRKILLRIDTSDKKHARTHLIRCPKLFMRKLSHARHSEADTPKLQFYRDESIFVLSFYSIARRAHVIC